MDDTARDAFDSYTPAPHFCELLDGALGSSPFGHLVRQRLAAIGLTELRARSRDAAIELATLDPAPMDGGDARSAGNAVGRGRPFDVLPRIVSAADWALLERGVRQRVAALNLFVQDIYGPQRILADGVVPAELVLDNAHYRPAMRDLRLPGDTYIPCYGIDLVRGRDGAFRVLEDNVRSPSGAFAILTNRRLMQRLFADLTHDLPLLEVGDYGRQLHEALTELAPAGSTPPQVVLLSPGALDADYGEHVFLADAMGVPLVEGGDLVVEDDRVLVRSGAVTLPVDVIYRRMSDDGLDPDSLQDVPGMVQAYARGRVNLANAIGTGVADDKAIYAYVPRLIRYYLAEDPVIDNVSTRICREPDDLAYTLDHLAELVVKPVGRSGETAVTVGPGQAAPNSNPAASASWRHLPTISASRCSTSRWHPRSPTRAFGRALSTCGSSPSPAARRGCCRAGCRGSLCERMRSSTRAAGTAARGIPGS